MSSGHRSDYPYAVVPQLPDGDAVQLDGFLPGDAPLEIELGPGRGSFLLERCVTEPNVRLLGIEVRRKWASVVVDRLERRGYRERARVVCNAAMLALTRLLPAGSVQAVFVQFPDPWWKKRHEKRLLVVDEVLIEVARLLCDSGVLFIQTDVPERADQYERLVAARPELVPAGDAPDSCRLAENPYAARSNREHRADEDGLPVYRLRYRRAVR
jgi:tRNA (guanine-N7-)-methyltransferase